jgi:hypothetical protein
MVKRSELVYTIVNPIASLSDLRNRYSPVFLLDFPLLKIYKSSSLNLSILKSIDYLSDFRSTGFIGEFDDCSAFHKLQVTFLKIRSYSSENEKTQGRKSSDTVPLKEIQFLSCG